MNNEIEKSVRLIAGPVTALFLNGDLRSIKVGHHEAINRIYFALRDQDWNTIPGRISKLEIKQSKDGFLITYHVDHKEGDINFSWEATIIGAPDGTIIFAFEGKALSTFYRNRIGLCVLHPINVAGNRVVVTHPDGSMTEGFFPVLISPHQPFKEIVSIRHFLPDVGEIKVSFSGDVFEMEDQRNWSDASFKTYSTPLDLPFPVKVYKGDQIQQSVTISPIVTELLENTEYKVNVLQDYDHQPRSSQQTDTITIGDPTGRKLIPLGLCWGHDMESLTSYELARLATLRLSHIRLELVLDKKHYEENEKKLMVVADYSRQLETPIELVLRVDSKKHYDFNRFFSVLRKAQFQVASWTVLSEGSPVTSAEHLSFFREKLLYEEHREPLGGGTRAFFAEINRNSLPIPLLDFVVYSLCPQVHATDELSMIENLEGQRATVESALVISQSKPIYVSPITLKMQWNPYATESYKLRSLNQDELPSEVDPRQRLTFAAAWTLGSIKVLSEAGASSATYYEIIGWRGVMEKNSGSLLPSLFPSRPSELFPLYFLFKAFGEVAGGEMYTVTTTDPFWLIGLAVQKESLFRLFVANYGPTDRLVRINKLSNTSKIYLLDSEATPPLLYHSASSNKPELILKPNAVAWIDQ